MLHAKVWLRVLLGLASSTIVGLPLAGYGGLQSLLLSEGAYEDRCLVGGGKVALLFERWVSARQVICAEQREAFADVYAMGSIAYALSALVALLALEYVGATSMTVAGALVLTAGTIVLPEGDPWGPFGWDPLRVGYALLCCGAPMLVGAALDAVALLNRPLVACLVLATLVQLSPTTWYLAVSAWSERQPLLSELMDAFLWVPFAILVGLLGLVLLPLVGSDTPDSKHDVLLHSLFPPRATDVWGTDSFPSDLDALPPVTGFSVPQLSISQSLLSSSVLLVVLNYTVQSLPLDLVMVSGQVRAQLMADADTALPLSIWSPLLAAVATPLIFWLGQRIHLISLVMFATICSVSITAAQSFAQVAGVWVGVAGAVQTVRTLQFWAALNIIARTCNFRVFEPALIFLLAGSALLETILLPYVDWYFTFEAPGQMALAPPLLCVAIQVIVGTLTCVMLLRIARKTRRQLLEFEAWQSWES